MHQTEKKMPSPLLQLQSFLMCSMRHSAKTKQADKVFWK